MSKLVVLDAGHGGKDAGAVNGTRFEKTDTWRMATEVKKLLEQQKVKVMLTRNGDEYVNIYDRPKIATRAKANALVSFHRNSFKDPTAKGAEIWIHPNARTSGTLATCIMDGLSKTGIQANRGIKKGSYIILNTPVPACMVELGFISNTEDNRLFDKNFLAYCEDITKGICEFLEVPYNGKLESDEKYRVQIGAFDVEANARAFLAEVQAKGMDAFLVAPGTTKQEH